jgi:hypothetical protein
MPRNQERKYRKVIDYVEDEVGVDIPDDVKVAAVSDVRDPLASEGMPSSIESIGGEPQSAVDVANKIDLIEDALESAGTDELRSRIHDSTGAQIDPATKALEDALKANDVDEFVTRITDSGGTEVDPMNQDPLRSVGNDELRSQMHVLDSGGTTGPLQTVTMDVAVPSNGESLVTYISRALQDVANDEIRSRLHDSSGTQIDPERAVDFPNQQVVGEDLTVDDTVIGPFTVAKSEALVVSVNETSGGSLNVTVDWTDGSGNTFQSESATDIGLSGVTEDWARLVRKGPQAIVTLSNSSNATSTNAHVDTEK